MFYGRMLCLYLNGSNQILSRKVTVESIGSLNFLEVIKFTRLIFSENYCLKAVHDDARTCTVMLCMLPSRNHVVLINGFGFSVFVMSAIH